MQTTIYHITRYKQSDRLL